MSKFARQHQTSRPLVACSLVGIMMRKIFTLICVVITTTTQAWAQSSMVVGSFSHRFSEVADAPVWTVKSFGRQFQIVSHGGNTNTVVVVLNEQERKDLWNALAFDIDTDSFLAAECVGAVLKEYICHVPSKSRAEIPQLRSRESDFFHYDKTGGLIEIHKIGAKK